MVTRDAPSRLGPPGRRRAVDFESFTRERWSSLGRPGGRAVLPMAGAPRLFATGQPVSESDVLDIYAPLAELITLLAAAKLRSDQAIDGFLGRRQRSVPFVVGIAGSVAVGKSTTAQLLCELLRRGPGGPSVDILTTDGFLHSNAELEARGLLERKGFPESYDHGHLIRVLAAVKSAAEEVTAPVYSHTAYDIVPGRLQRLRRPAFLIVEGLNVLQGNRSERLGDVVVSDFIDFALYVDAAEDDIARWFLERLLVLRATVMREPDAYFHRFSGMPEDEVVAVGRHVWAEVNLVNLRENVAPTRRRAHLILEKAPDHRVCRVLLRRP